MKKSMDTIVSLCKRRGFVFPSSEIYGGSNVGNMGGKPAEENSVHGRPYSIALTLPPLATIVMVHED